MYVLVHKYLLLFYVYNVYVMPLNIARQWCETVFWQFDESTALSTVKCNYNV